MPRITKRAGRQRPPLPQSFIFEIKEWEPGYILSVNHDKYRDTVYSEHTDLELKTECIFPSKLAGRSALFVIMSGRDCLVPEIFRRDPEWRPRCVGLLELHPSGGRFYMSVRVGYSFSISMDCNSHDFSRSH
jgi:hypothetical protein